LKKLSIRTTFTLATLIMLAPAAFAQDASADEGLHVNARLGVEHDSNVLRASTGQVSDTAYNIGAGLRYNKQFSLQRIRADVQWDTWRYSDHSELNFNTLNYALGWDWAITPVFHGTVSAERRQFREVTTDPVLLTNRIGRRTERTELAEAGFGVSGPFRVVAGVSHYRTESTEPGSWDASPDITFWHVGAGYEAASGSNVTFRYKRGQGEYHDPTFLATVNSDFRDTEEELAARWAFSGKTTFTGRLAHVQRRHTVSALDFSGWAGAFNVNWDITGKTSLVAGYMHDISATGLPTGGHVDSDRFFISPVWHATAKTSFNARYDRTRREWKDVSLVPVSAFAGRTDTVESLGIGADWEALRTITVSAYLRREKLSSSITNTGYRANVIGVQARGSF
jgi:exopolysaccharide biosynthesis operon protein EpsL